MQQNVTSGKACWNSKAELIISHLHLSFHFYISIITFNPFDSSLLPSLRQQIYTFSRQTELPPKLESRTTFNQKHKYSHRTLFFKYIDGKNAGPCLLTALSCINSRLETTFKCCLVSSHRLLAKLCLSVCFSSNNLQSGGTIWWHGTTIRDMYIQDRASLSASREYLAKQLMDEMFQMKIADRI
jgi:hypothetical protein